MCAQGITTCGGSAKVAYKEALGEYVVFPFSKVTKKPHQLVDCSKGRVANLSLLDKKVTSSQANRLEIHRYDLQRSASVESFGNI